MKRNFFLGLTTLFFSGLLYAALAGPPQGGTWVVWAGKPRHDGSATLTVEVKYQDPVTSQVRHATIQASVPNVSKNWTKEEKAQALHDALVSQGDKQSVGGQPLIEIGDTTGTGFLVAPGADRQSTMPDGSVEGANNLQIEDARVKDSHTHAHDVVQEPPKGAAGASAIAMISMSGGITGMDPDGQPSEISIFTNLGEAVVALDGTMTPLDAAEDLVDQLKALGIDAVLDRDRGSILVVLTDQVGGISAGTDDAGIDWIETAVMSTL